MKAQAEKSTGKNMHQRLKDMQSMIRMHQFLIKSAHTEVEFEIIKTQLDVSYAMCCDIMLEIVQSLYDVRTRYKATNIHYKWRECQLETKPDI